MTQDNEPPAPKKVVGIRPDVEIPDNVVPLNTTVYCDIPTEKVYNSAIKADLETVIIVGYYKDGTMYLASSTGDSPLIYWALEHAKRITLESSE